MDSPVGATCHTCPPVYKTMNTLTYILIGVIAVLVIALIVSFVTRPKTKVLSDDLPNGDVTRYGVLKLQNEIRPYIRTKDGKIYLTIVLPKTK